MGVPTIIIARTDAEAANLITSDIDERDQSFSHWWKNWRRIFYREERTGTMYITRTFSMHPSADIIWMETSHPDLEVARQFAKAIHSRYPGKLLAYNCSPSFNWSKHLSENEMATFREELGWIGI